VQNITDVLPSLMADLIQSAPQNQKEKISKLLDIWERAQTFPQKSLASFKQMLTNPQNSKIPSPTFCALGRLLSLLASYLTNPSPAQALIPFLPVCPRVQLPQTASGDKLTHST